MSQNLPATVTSSTFRSASSLKRSTSGLKIAALSMAAVTLAATAVLWQPTSVAAQAAPAANTPEFYTQRVLPIFKDNCYHCHGGMFHRGGLSMSSREGMMKGGHDGAVIVPGNAEQSLLIKLIRHEGPVDDPMPMPPKHKLSDDEIAIVTQWVQAGAVMPASQPSE